MKRRARSAHRYNDTTPMPTKRVRFTPMGYHNSLPLSIVSWNAAGFWISPNQGRGLRLKTARQILARYDLLLVQEAHIEREDLRLFRQQADDEGWKVFVGLTPLPPGAIAAAARGSDSVSPRVEESIGARKRF